MIKGGYYLKARCIQESAIATAPPVARELWDWLLKECNHKEVVSSGRAIERGQCVRTYEQIQEGLKWMKGWQIKRYSKWDIERAMKKLRTLSMITTEKTTKGMLITVLKYNFYQNPKNYSNSSKELRREIDDHIESHTENHEPHVYITKNGAENGHSRNHESHTPATTKATDSPQTRHTINKNEKNKKNKSTINSSESPKGKWMDRLNKDLQEVINYAHSKGFSLQGNKTWNRRAAYNLIRTKDPDKSPLGVERVKKLIDLAMTCRGEQYAPQVNDFVALGKKWQDLMAFADKRMSAKGRIG